MEIIKNKQRVLICSAPVLCITMMVLMPLATALIGKTAGYILGFCLYWFAICIPVSFYCSGGWSGLKEIYSQKSDIPIINRIAYYLLAGVSCLATLFVIFLKVAPNAGMQVLAIAFSFALINGTIEELYWRGTFNKVFEKNIGFAYFYPSVFFGIWHIALFFAKGVVYQGGFASLVGGAFFLGVLWGWVAFKTKSIRIVTAAHILTNFFGFTGLIYENWFI
ncbi:MAG: CPBP family intramembrane metalloprotease [Clostridia bacterium]|nr:CPBP family intramembrane metalloprotease [Clostridia bacterium]